MIPWFVAAGILAGLQAWTGWWGWVGVVPFAWAFLRAPGIVRGALLGAAAGGGVWLSTAAIAGWIGGLDGAGRVAALLEPITAGSTVALLAWTAAAGGLVAGCAAAAGAAASPFGRRDP